MSHLPAYEDGRDRCSETSSYKLQAPGNYPKGSIQHLILLFCIGKVTGSNFLLNVTVQLDIYRGSHLSVPQSQRSIV